MMDNYFFRPLSVALLMVLVSTQAQAGVIGHWRFDETSGTTAADSVNGNDAMYVASDDPVPGWQTGLIGGATGLNDEDDDMQEYFSIPSIPEMAGATQLTISIWFNENDGPNDNNGNNGLIRVRDLKNSGNPTIDRVAGMNWESNTIDARINGGPSQTDSGEFADGPGWHNATMTWDANDDSGGAGTGIVKVYVDGVFSNSTSFTGSSKTIVDSGNWWIGGVDCCPTSRGWTGALDDLVIWDEVLTPQAISDIYFDGLFGIDGPTAWLESITPFTPGDVTGDEMVTSADFSVIQQNFGQNLGLRTEGDLVNNNFIDLDDYLQWKLAPKDPESLVASGQSVPEPSTLILLSSAALLFRGRFRA